MKIELGNFEMEVIHHNPLIYTLLGVLSDIECEHLKEISWNFMQRSTVSSIDSSEEKSGSIDKRRTSKNCWVKHSHSGITLSLAKKISKLVQMPLENAEAFQVLHYDVEEEYQPHMDTFEQDTDLGRAFLGNSGQRIITVLGYLNDVEKGGETSFPNIDKIVKPKKGKVVVFQNCHAGSTSPNKGALHGACPVVMGEKWAFNLWYRESKAEEEH
ncbi:MAG: 2OG-Fe(II) oxygenase [SAR86 cluster bacterium]|jgi:prolyl 4-hydroxylase|nr:2OG-Fe(II) oxygenase [SAR86 cluster bacterium]